MVVSPSVLDSSTVLLVGTNDWLTRFAATLERVNDELEAEMQAAWGAVKTEFERRDVTWRDAAYIVALSRIAEAHEARGLWP